MADTGTLQSNTGELAGALARAKQLLERGELQQAITALEGADVPVGPAAALRGAAYFRLEQYDKAADELKKALADAPTDKSLRKLHERAVANHAADVKRH